jgi:hypothetical protein
LDFTAIHYDKNIHQRFSRYDSVKIKPTKRKLKSPDIFAYYVTAAAITPALDERGRISIQ